MGMKSLLHPCCNRRGATIVLVAFAMVVLIGFAALAIDLGYLYVVKNELQNAADSGALAGAQVLYINNGTAVNPGANAVAQTLVNANYSEQSAASVKSIERGHWSFATKTFTPNETTLLPVSLWNVTAQQLDADVNFINAVRVITTRKIDAATGKPEEPFFAKIFGIPGPVIEAAAVAYIGFAGTLTPAEVDQPIAICRQSILNFGSSSEQFTCGVGRMINSGSNDGHQTGGWTNFSQPCETASASSVKPLVCASGNPNPIAMGQGMGTTGGEVQTAFNSLYSCWKAYADTNSDGVPDRPWSLTLPVVDCPGNNTGNCSTVMGAVEINIVWITQTDKNQMKEVPRTMLNPLTGTQWNCSTSDTSKAGAQICWNEFVTEFKLKDVLSNSNAFYEDKTMYFIPDCKPHTPMGTTGGQNYGILARIPVLVN
jgi:Flp pilus assembly protein TadG